MGRISEWTVPDGAPSRAVRDLVCRALRSLRTRSVRLGAEAGHPTRSRGSFHPCGGGNADPPLSVLPRCPCTLPLARAPTLSPSISLFPSFSLGRHLFAPLSLSLSLSPFLLLSPSLAPSLSRRAVTRARDRLVCI